MSTRDPKLMLANKLVYDELVATRQKRDALLAACVAVNDWVLGYMDFGERPCPFCDHHHVHSEDCLYITLQAAITSAEA